MKLPENVLIQIIEALQDTPLPDTSIKDILNDFKEFKENRNYDLLLTKVIETIFYEENYVFQNNRFKFIQQEGGGEGSGEYVSYIFQFDEYYILCELNYFSHYGYNFDNLSVTLCEPKQVTVTQYFPITGE